MAFTVFILDIAQMTILYIEKFATTNKNYFIYTFKENIIYTVYSIHYTVGCTKIWRFYQKITEPSQKLGLTIRRKHANF